MSNAESSELQWDSAENEKHKQVKLNVARLRASRAPGVVVYYDSETDLETLMHDMRSVGETPQAFPVQGVDDDLPTIVVTVEGQEPHVFRGSAGVNEYVAVKALKRAAGGASQDRAAHA